MRNALIYIMNHRMIYSHNIHNIEYVFYGLRLWKACTWNLMVYEKCPGLCIV